jgi:phosphopantothenoylcysteine synthetase/decarboxylase
LYGVTQQLCKWADMVLIAPLDANTLAKLAHGLCDNLVVLYAFCTLNKDVRDAGVESR